MPLHSLHLPRVLRARERVAVSEARLRRGGLGLVLPPVANHIAQLVLQRPPTTLALIDVNCRPLVITQPDEYRARLNAVVAAADVVKVSVEALHYLYAELASMTGADRVLEGGRKAGDRQTTISIQTFCAYKDRKKPL